MLILNFNPFPLIFTNRLALREIILTDVNEIFELRSDVEVMKYIDRPMATTVDDASQYIQKNMDALHNNEGITWGIGLKNEPALIGTIGFWRIEKEHYRAEIGYMLHRNHQQKGIMQEAITAVLQFGFSNMNLHSAEATINPKNEASKKLLLQNNFIQEAYFRENYFYNGKFLDSAIYSLLTPFNTKMPEQF